MDPWELIAEGRYREAATAYTAELRRGKSAPNYWNRGVAYLNLGQYDRAIADFKTANETDEDTSDAYLQSVGTVHWLAGRESDAARVWLDLVLAMERGKIQYTDAAGGVESACLLWFAAIRLEEDELLRQARRLLSKKARNKSSASWPGPVAEFLLGRVDDGELRQRVASVPILRERELCQAEFYIGVRALEVGDSAAAKKAFGAAARLHPAKLEHEYYLATHEFNRLAGSAPAKRR
jgi:lipoprotein NlpI